MRHYDARIRQSSGKTRNGVNDLLKCKRISLSRHWFGQQTAQYCVACEQGPALTRDDKSDEDTSVYLHTQHMCSTETVYEVEEDLIDVQDNHDTTETQSKFTSR